jgi:outer membrane protein TolC
MRRSQLAVLISIFCSSCAVTAKYQVPAMPTPPAFKGLDGSEQFKTAVPGDGLLKGRWWEIFNDTELSKLEEQVGPSNYSLKQLEAEFRESLATIAINRSAYFPTVTTSPSITQSDRGPNAGGQPGHGTSSTFEIPFGATWVPDLWNRVGLSVQNANATAQENAANLENTRLTLQAALAVDYYELRGNDMQFDLLNANIKIYTDYLKLTNDRFGGGVAAKSDVDLAETQLYQTEAQATALGVLRNQYEHAIAVLIGKAPAEFSIAPVKVTGPLMKPASDLPTATTAEEIPEIDYSAISPPPIPVGVPSTLLQRRPDVAGMERAVAAANANIGIARTAWFPTLTLGATPGLVSSSLLNLLTWGSRSWSAGPALAQTIFDAGKRKAQLRQSLAAYDATADAYRETVLTAFQQVEDNLSTLRVLALEAQQQALAVRAADESLALELERYKAGTDSALNVITTQQIALSNEINAVTLLQSRMVAAVNLVMALGGGWDSSTLPTNEQMKGHDLEDPAKALNVAQPPVR